MEKKKNFSTSVCAAVHKVMPGETLYSIARSYGTDIHRLMKLNGIVSPDILHAGEELCIPSEAFSDRYPAPDSPDKRRFHIIRPGDTLYLLSRRYGIPLSLLMQFNPEIDPYNLRPGSKIIIPDRGQIPVPASESAVTATAGSNSGDAVTADTHPAGSIPADTLTIRYNHTDANPAGSNPAVVTSDTHPAEAQASEYDTSGTSDAPAFSDSKIRSSAELTIAPVQNSTAAESIPFETADSAPSAPSSVTSVLSAPSPASDSVPYALSEASEASVSYESSAYSDSDSLSDGIIHPVSEGETLTSILTGFGLCYCALHCENPETDLTGNLSDKIICIPYEDSYRLSPANQSYIVRNGDTLFRIAEKTGVSTDKLLQMNPLSTALDFSVAGNRIKVR